MKVDWSNKVVLITGASSGIGRALAVELGKRGASTGLLARRADSLREVAREVEAAGGRALVLPADVKDAASVRAAADELRAEFGAIDVLVANAGVGVLTDDPARLGEQVAETIEINLIGAANSAGAVLPEMIARGEGQLVAISSLASYRGLPKSGAYCASKAAMNALFESLRIDLKGTGVAVTIIKPGFIKTPLTAGREAQMPYLLELDDATRKILRAIEARRTAYAFPWQLASIVRLARFFPDSLYDRIILRRQYRE
ncbi:MAG: SDR family NAD(P)-dependent oxidoreductase [Acidobacteria bacterium]|nr:SDR family NAD(P)-dependent oxidoreductase [Acidobacteriota bacterium]MCA1642398.1 SDR family NAD(P)-dependent oxidoreductase [Acidobacteriota bacterium]